MTLAETAPSPLNASKLRRLRKAARRNDHYAVIDEGRALLASESASGWSIEDRLEIGILLASSYHLLRMNALAMAQADALLSLPGLSGPALRRARTLHARVAPLAGRSDEAVAGLQALLDERPHAVPLRLQLAHLLTARDPQRSLALLREAHGLAKGTEAAIPLAECLMRLGRLEEAAQVLAQGRRKEPDRHLLLLAGAALRLRQGRPHGWARCFGRFLTLTGGGTTILVSPDGSREALQRLPVAPAAASPSPTARVVVVMTAYNAQATVAAAVRSVLAQTYAGFRLVVVDDASTDGTRALLHRLAAEDPRVVVMESPENVGAYRCRNLAIEACPAEFHAFHDADDWMHPDRLARHLAWMDGHPDAVLCNSKWFRMTPDGAPHLLGGVQYVMTNPASIFVRACAFERAGLFEPGRFGGDSEFIWRLRRVFGHDAVQTLDLVLAVGLARPDSLTASYAPTDEDGRSDVRTAYNEAWMAWHLSEPPGGRLFMPSDPARRPFPLPRQIDDRAPASTPVVAAVATGAYAQTWAFAIASQRRYAQRHGLEHRLFDACRAGLNAKWSKLLLARELVAQGRDVLLLDADASVSESCPDFSRVLAENPGRDIGFVLGVSGRPNSGVLLFRGGPDSLAPAFLDRCLESRAVAVPAESFVTADGENGHVIHVLRQSPFREASVELDQLWNCMRPEIAPLAYIRHYTNQLGKALRGGAPGAGGLRPWIFCWPVTEGSLYANLLLAPLGERFRPVFVEEGGLPQATARLHMGVPTLVHVHWEEFLLNPAMSAAEAAALVEGLKRDLALYRAAGGRLVWTIHNPLPHQIPYLDAFLDLRRHLAEVADVVLVHSDAAGAFLRRQAPTLNGRVERLDHPSYEGAYEPSGTAAAALTPDFAAGRTVLGFGRIEPRKGFARMIEALPPETLAAQGARIRIAGHGAHGRALRRAFAARKDIDWDLRFVPAEEVGPLLRDAACLVLPYERFLTSGVALLALTVGAVIVAPQAGQFYELLPEAGHRLLYREGDAADLRRAVLDALALSPQDSLALRRAGLEVAARLHPSVIARRLGAIYDAELAATLPRAPAWQESLEGMDLVETGSPAPTGAVVGAWPTRGLLADNWGDKLNPALISLLSGRQTIHVREAAQSETTVVNRVIGSGLQDAKPREVIWGSGFIRSNAPAPDVRRICAVRGPLTRDRLLAQGADCPEVYGDPAVLMPLFYRPRIAPDWDLGVIQHFRDAGTEPLPHIPDGMRVKVIDILGSVTGVIDEILSCRQIVSSSLHGLIAAHAYGIPATWIKFGHQALGDGFKFRDYWASVGWSRAEPVWVNQATSCADLVGPLTTVRPLIDIPALIEACPFIDPARKGVLLLRATEILPAMPNVSFLAAASPRSAISGLEAEEGGTDDGRPLLSVIIAVRNWGLDRLELSLRSIREGERGDRMEIVLCDFGSDARGAAAALGARFGCTNLYVEAPQWSRAQAINAAARHATAPFLVTGDADILFAPRTLATLHAQLAALPQAVHAVSYFDLPEEFPVSGIAAFPAFPWDEFARSAALRPRWGMGCAACSVEVFDAVRGYDERMVVWGAEDRDFVDRCRRNGFPLHWVEHPDVALYHIWHKPFLTGGQTSVDIHVHNKRLMKEPTLERNYLPHVHLRSRSPLASVVIATRNRAELLRASIESVLNQTVEDFELIVVDDGSTDDTPQAAAGFDDPRIRVVRRAQSGGVAAARNQGNRLARGKYIAVHDDDDLMFPDRLERQIAAIRPGDVGSYGGWIDFTSPEQGGDLTCNPGRSPFELGPLMFSSKLQIHPALLLRRELCLNHPYEESFAGGSDYNLVLRLAMAGYRLAHCDRYVILRRLHGANLTYLSADRQKVASRMSRSFILGFMPAEMEDALRRQGAATGLHTIRQPELAEQVRDLLGEDYLCATDRLAYDQGLFDALRQNGLTVGVTLSRKAGAVAPEALVLDRRQRGAYAALVSGAKVSSATPRLRTKLKTQSFNSRLLDRRLDDNRLRPFDHAPTSPEIEFFHSAGGRVVALRFAAQDWAGLARLAVPFDAAEPTLLLFDANGGWSLLFKLGTDLEFSIRAVIAAAAYPSVGAVELVEEALI